MKFRTMSDCHEALTGFPVVIRIPVVWGDLDPFDHVNNTTHLRWCETARVEYLIRIGLWPEMPPEGIGPILASITCDYRLPINYPDTVWIGARVTAIGNSSFKMDHVIVSEAQNAVVAEVKSTMVVLDYSRKKTVPVPDAVREAIVAQEGREFVRA